MAVVKIKGKDIEVEVPDGSCLIELKNKTEDIIFACGVVMCGSCLARIVEGLENLEEPYETRA